MTVKELIEELSKLNENYEVKVQYRNDDEYWGTDDEVWLEVDDDLKEVVL
jgi:hypothetical protein